MTPVEYKPVPQVNDTCTGCAFKWIKNSGCIGPCPDWARERCTDEKIIWKAVKK